MNSINTEFAENLGREFAEELNASPADAQNWSRLGKSDDVPDMDYVALRDHYRYGDLEQCEIAEIEQAYRNGFNSAFTA